MKEKYLLPMNLQFFAEDEGETSETMSEVAEQTEVTETPEVTETEPTGETDVDTTEPQTQSKETNAAFASMRRELQAARQAQAEIDRYYAEQFGNYTNPETGAPIKSAKDYLDAMAAQQRIQAREKLEAANIDPKVLDSMIANSPVVRQAQAATEELNQFRAQQQLERDYQEIMKFDPTVGSAEDILNAPNMQQVYDKVATGMSLVDAYKIVNFERLASSYGAAAKQAAINSVKAKNHLATGAALNVDDTSVDIPASQLEMYKEAFPDKSIKEIKALYNRALGARKG